MNRTCSFFICMRILLHLLFQCPFVFRHTFHRIHINPFKVKGWPPVVLYALKPFPYTNYLFIIFSRVYGFFANELASWRSIFSRTSGNVASSSLMAVPSAASAFMRLEPRLDLEQQRSHVRRRVEVGVDLPTESPAFGRSGHLRRVGGPATCRPGASGERWGIAATSPAARRLPGAGRGGLDPRPGIRSVRAPP